MTQRHGPFEAASAELLAYADRLDGDLGARWHLPTPCSAWDVAALSNHVASVAIQQEEAFHRPRFAIAEPPSTVIVDGDPDGLAESIRRSADHLADAAAGQADRRWPTVPLPYATMPVSAAPGALILEYGAAGSP